MNRLRSLQLQICSISDQKDSFQHVQLAPEDSILGLNIAFAKDTDPNKINLGVGAYRDQNGKPYVFEIVRKVERDIQLEGSNHEYLPIDGSQQFTKGCRNLVFGRDSKIIKQKLIATVQTMSGAGALRTALQFLSIFLKRKIYVSNPSWPIHEKMVQKVGLQYGKYPYYSQKLKGLDFLGMMKFFSQIQSGSIVILHASAHNPTGIDLNQDQWKQLSVLFKQKQLFPFFDLAYQGYATGDLNRDSWAVRHFAQEGFQMLVAQSFAKNLGLYGERVGALHIVCRTEAVTLRVLSQLKIIIRLAYSNPSRYGSQIASRILNKKQYFQQWEKQLKQVVAKRIIDMRYLLRSELQKLKTPGTWNHITDQIGMFSYTGLSEKTCDILMQKYHIYLLKSGRISMAGVNKHNVGYLARSINNAIRQNDPK